MSHPVQAHICLIPKKGRMRVAGQHHPHFADEEIVISQGGCAR